jgi:hypothetical protein
MHTLLLHASILVVDLRIVTGFVRNDLGLIRGHSIVGATIDMPCILARFGYFFGKEAFASYLTRNQFGGFRRRIRITRRIRKFGSRI